MPVKTILVLLNAINRNEMLMAAACAIAAKQDAHVIGLYVVPGAQLHYVGAGIDGVVDVNVEKRNYYQSAADSIQQAFEESIRRQGISGEWRYEHARQQFIADLVITHSRQVDLVIASQLTDNESRLLESELIDRVVMEVGRPVLLIPNSGSIRTIATRVLVGWNGTREAARAVGDAIPLLENANETVVCWVNAELHDESKQLPGAELARALARHDIDVTTDAVSTRQSNIGAVLLDKAQAIDADLIVIGAYGHSRFREFVFGGVTKHILEAMTIPVLMSH